MALFGAGFVVSLVLFLWFLVRFTRATMDDTAPGWRIRCRTCDHHRKAGEAGIIRLYASGTSYTLARCSQCDAATGAVIERDPDYVPNDVDTAQARRVFKVVLTALLAYFALLGAALWLLLANR